MKISLYVNGKLKKYSASELRSKLERLEELEKNIKPNTEIAYEISNIPVEGKCFVINPQLINEKLFQEKRSDLRQELTRKIIVRALEEVKKHKRKYYQQFATLIPEKTWNYKTANELKQIAEKRGNHIADWVEQALEWAQRINNGESWQKICNDPDTANWYRLIIWEDGIARIVGGSKESGDNLSATTVFGNFSYSNDILRFTVPLIVIYV